MFAMDGAVVDVSEMQGLLSLAESPALEDTLALVGRLTAGPKTYRDVGSRSAAGSPEKRENLRRWRYLQDRVAACIPNP